MVSGKNNYYILYTEREISMKPAIRTDLAMEARELARQATGRSDIPGVHFSSYEDMCLNIDVMDIETQEGADILCKPIGRYVTAEIGKFLRRNDDAFEDSARGLGKILCELLALKENSSVLIACLGNPAITPDAIGPLCAQNLMVTRHLKDRMPDTFAPFRTVSVVCPGVLGTTGIESAALVRAAVETVKPDAVIAVDALASRSMERLCRTVQICDSGISPGSGVGNHRNALDKESLGVPVIAVGVPTVVDAATLVIDLTGGEVPEHSRQSSEMIVTPRDIDSFVSDAAKLVAYGINFALHDGLGIGDIDMFVS